MYLMASVRDGRVEAMIVFPVTLVVTLLVTLGTLLVTLGAVSSATTCVGCTGSGFLSAVLVCCRDSTVAGREQKSLSIGRGWRAGQKYS